MGEYDPLTGRRRAEGPDDLEQARDLFAAAGRAFLVSPWPWLAWGVLLPAAALSTPAAASAGGPAAVLALWSATILLGGAVELFLGIRRGRRLHGSTPLGGWVLNVQGNLSLVGLLLSAALLWAGRGELLPGVWLLLLGHSFYQLGGIAFPPFRLYGLLYQAGGAVALWPVGVNPLVAFAAVTAAANFWLGWAVSRERANARSADRPATAPVRAAAAPAARGEGR
jgi:hypothetical protein